MNSRCCYLFFDAWLLDTWYDDPKVAKNVKGKSLMLQMPESARNEVFANMQGTYSFKRQFTALAIHLDLLWECQGKVTDGGSTGQGAISARCRMPRNTSTIQGDSCDIASEPCHLTTVHKRARQQAKVLTLFCREGVHEARAKWNLA